LVSFHCLALALSGRRSFARYAGCADNFAELGSLYTLLLVYLTGLLVTYSKDYQIGFWLVLLAVANVLFVLALMVRAARVMGLCARCRRGGSSAGAAVAGGGGPAAKQQAGLRAHSVPLLAIGGDREAW
jgi:hypothetical protein